MLDQINSCLDDLEERNDALNAKLKDLLESNRQARQEFREQQRDAIREPPSSHPSQPAEGDQREQ
ncbi:CI016 protein, partial [Amia calva]|nr:CI016 protein [Amia calva]